MAKYWCHLDEIADVHLGFKSLQNEFFYLSAKEVENYSIESQYLKDIFVLSDFDSQKFLQSPEQSTWLFYCRGKENDLRGTAALKYIQAMANRPATLKKQGSGKQTTIKNVLEAQGGGLWYAPKATPHKGHIWLRKAFGSVFAPYIFQSPAVVDQRCNRVVPKDGVSWEELASIMTSSLFALALEGDGASSMGGGALEWKTKSLREAKIIDLRRFDGEERSKLVVLAQTAWNKATPTDFTRDSQPQKPIIELDEFILNLIGNPITVELLYADLSATVKQRLQKSKSRKLLTKTQEVTDIGETAATISATIRPTLEAKRFPEDFHPISSRNQRIDVPATHELSLNAEPFMSVAKVSIQDEAGNQLIDTQYPVHVAELIVRTLLFGRRNFPAPLDEDIAIDKLKAFSIWIEEIVSEIDTNVATSALGTRYEEQLKEAVLKELGIDSSSYAAEVWGSHQLYSSK
jgi:hypothetical protein